MGPLSTTCAGSLGVGDEFGPGQGNFSGTAQTNASTTGTLTFASATALDVWRVNASGAYFGRGDRYFASARATAATTDTVTIFGAGSLAGGFLRLVFNVDGSVLKLKDEFSGDGFDPTMPGDDFFAHGEGVLAVNATSDTFTSGKVVTLDVPLSFASPQALSLRFWTFASADILNSEGYRITADFFHTATLVNAVLLDPSKQPFSGAWLSSSTGFTYPGLSASPQYTFTGFLSPIASEPTVNAAKAGSAVPIRFGLGGDHGMAIFSAGYPRAQVMQCVTGAPTDTIQETVTAGGSSLSYDAASGLYTYVWKSERSWAGSCRQLQVKLADGELFTARFTFSR